MNESINQSLVATSRWGAPVLVLFIIACSESNYVLLPRWIMSQATKTESCIYFIWQCVFYNSFRILLGKTCNWDSSRVFSWEPNTPFHQLQQVFFFHKCQPVISASSLFSDDKKLVLYEENETISKTPSTDVFDLCLVEYKKSRPLRISGTWKDYHCIHLLPATWPSKRSITLRVFCLVNRKGVILHYNIEVTHPVKTIGRNIKRSFFPVLLTQQI